MNNDNIKFFFSERGIPLVYWTEHEIVRPVLTIENYLKWYYLYLVDTNGEVSKIDFPDEYSDHCPNPLAVAKMAAKNNWELDDQAYEMIIGRWEMEHNENPAYDIFEIL